VRVSVHLVSGGQYYRAGDEIPDDQVPAPIRRAYAQELASQRESMDDIGKQKEQQPAGRPPRKFKLPRLAARR
jgi:hypothetical protein